MVKLHVFADASSCAYGTLYLQFKSRSEVKCCFVIGKLRIVPVKENSFSISKLELQVAVTASRISNLR